MYGRITDGGAGPEIGDVAREAGLTRNDVDVRGWTIESGRGRYDGPVSALCKPEPSKIKPPPHTHTTL